ncbi:DUF742 domain-containing protein [Nocardiopsis sp. L17-MgMaSL7]|uniref:DUF742 domain-containing protein n=1 Tax=Nocardiopsis sp. L17-MgMaSL7 TaxID=1938893 RepID=UPI000D70DA53|nr:DUF742 domain-containing protein [Nocardiopsis sp. L17-MgMaSL7]PWV46401.1 uncharacterized protein DUF742 [Nocardiopsis sp. L17-MgMaSL7]
MTAEGRRARRLTERGPADRTDGNGRRPADEGEDVGNERFLRPYAVDVGTAERAAPRPTDSADLDLLTLVVAARTPGRHEWLRPEREAILNHARRARTVAELAAEVGLPMGQVRSMVTVMVAEGALQRCGPSRPLGHEDILHAVLVGLRSL